MHTERSSFSYRHCPLSVGEEWHSTNVLHFTHTDLISSGDASDWALKHTHARTHMLHTDAPSGGFLWLGY